MHVINRLYQEEFDFAHRDESPTMQYMIATIPRSGSTYFALELWRTGVLGAPMEYANAPYISILKNRLGVDIDILKYWSEVEKRRTSANGVFGYKMFIGNYLHCEENHPDLLKKIAPDKVIFLTRRDSTAQAVSLTKAVQSKAWFHGVEALDKPKYSFEEIRRGVNQVKQEIATWERIFELTETDVLPVFYEDLVADPGAVVRKVSDYLEVNLDPASTLDIPAIKVQRTSESLEWMRKFEAENNAISDTNAGHQQEVAV
jgi:LPS sulfotransferase NodH